MMATEVDLSGPADTPQWDAWSNAQYDLCRSIDDLVAEHTNGRSRAFRVAVHAAVIEHLAEQMRSGIDLPETDAGADEAVVPTAIGGQP